MMFLADVTTDLTYTCGSIGIEFNGMFPYIVTSVITIIKIVVPILLIIFGMIDLVKAVTAGKEDEIKKAQSTFIKRLIIGILVFFVIILVQMLVSFVSNKDSNVSSCFDCFVNGHVGDSACKVVK